MGERINVLIVDDEENILKCIVSYLAFSHDLQITGVTSFRAALEAIRIHRPRISIVDVGLPDGDGLDLIRQARRMSPVNQVIMMTGADDIVRVVDALELGAMDYLVKPLDLSLLSKIVSEAIERCRRWENLMQTAQTRLVEL